MAFTPIELAGFDDMYEVRVGTATLPSRVQGANTIDVTFSPAMSGVPDAIFVAANSGSPQTRSLGASNYSATGCTLVDYENSSSSGALGLRYMAIRKK